MSFPPDYKQLLSQTIALAGGESRVLLSPQFDSHKRYRLSVSETSGLGSVLISVDLLHSINQQQIQFNISPGGGSAIELSGSAVISGLAQGGPPTVVINITELMPSIELVQFTDTGIVLGAGYADLGSNGGFPQPFYSYVAVFLTNVSDVALVGIGGGLIAEFLAIPPASPILNQIRLGSNMRVQARGAVGTATPVWYNRR